jgi:ATP-GRASP peptide maturase of grasp-with-spasm system
MILIISIDQDDSTTDVIKWLMYYNQPFIRINEDDIINNFKWDINNKLIEFDCNNRRINFKEISAVWYRKGNIKFKNISKAIKNNKLITETHSFIEYEHKSVSYAFHYYLRKKTVISNYNYSKVNKIEVLELAEKTGLKIPLTRILSNKKELSDFLLDKGTLITKVLSYPVEYYADTYWLPTYTEEINTETIKTIPEKFGLSLFQVKIKKKYELRIVYLKDKFYSMAIFSQLDKQTSVDFRKYNHKKPNRKVPYKLPIEIENRLSILMKKLNLNFGSIDMIVNTNGEYVFLEVNPLGQFAMTSYPCNYYLDKIIAKQLQNY